MQRLAKTAVLSAMALALSAAETLIPVGLIIPVPGLRLGLSNIIILFILFIDGFPMAFTVTLLRCVLGAFFAPTGLMAAAYSLAGGLSSLFIMTVMKKTGNRVFSIIGISTAGAAGHNTAQICVAAFFLSDTSVFIYLPLLLAASLFTGGFTAAAAHFLIARFKRFDLLGISR